MTIESEAHTLECGRLINYKGKVQARDIAPDTRDDGSAEGIIETMRIGLTSTDMPIPEMLGDG